MTEAATPTAWKRTTIREIVRGLYDGPHATPKPASEGPVFLGIKNITDDGRLDLSEIRHVSEEEFPRWTKRVLPQPGDIVFTYEATLNRYAIIPEGFRGCLGRRLALIRPNLERVDTRYLFYYFFGEDWRRTISQNTLSGSTVDRIPLTHFPSFEVQLPPLPTQRKIASVLSAYDDLIENNTRRIKILEEMAQRIYREWFIHFRFPGYEKVGMVDSELGPIPEGWEVKRLGEVVSGLESGKRPRGGVNASDSEVPSIGAENITGLGRYNYSKEKYVSQDFFDSMKRGHIQNKDVLLYKDGAHIGKKSMFRDNFPHAVCCINEHVFILRTNGLCNQSYLYFWLDQPKMTQNIRNLNANAAQPGINQKGVRSLPILIPPSDLLGVFDSIVETLLAELFNLAKKNNTLRHTRDLLLPKLISGEVSVEAHSNFVGANSLGEEI